MNLFVYHLIMLETASELPTVYFVGGYPACTREVALYRRQPRQLRQTLQDCQGDEVAHREEAAAAGGGGGDSGPVLRVWGWIVGVGSRGAVAICRCL